jgi:uncharacterized protein YndB with AHSA1/START domain
MALAVAAVLAAGGPAFAQASTANGFVVQRVVSINAPPMKVYDTLVHVGLWWDPEHTYSGDAKNLSIDPRPGGCFCEKLPNGGGIEHLRVIYVAPGELLRASGGLGPLQAGGVSGTLTWRLTKVSEGTTVELVYVVGGFLEEGFEAVAPAVDSVLAEQLARLERFIETGNPARDR